MARVLAALAFSMALTMSDMTLAEHQEAQKERRLGEIFQPKRCTFPCSARVDLDTGKIICLCAARKP